MCLVFSKAFEDCFIAMGSKFSRQRRWDREIRRIRERHQDTYDRDKRRHEELVRELEEYRRSLNTETSSTVPDRPASRTAVVADNNPDRELHPETQSHTVLDVRTSTSSGVLNQLLSTMSEQELRINLALASGPARSSDGESSEASSDSGSSQPNPQDVPLPTDQQPLQDLWGSNFESRLLEPEVQRLAPTPAPLTLPSFLSPTPLPRSASALLPCQPETPAALPRSDSLPSLTVPPSPEPKAEPCCEHKGPKYCLICADTPTSGNALVNCWQCTATWCLKHYNKLPNKECPQCRASLLSLSVSSGDSVETIVRPQNRTTTSSVQSSSRSATTASGSSSSRGAELLQSIQRMEQLTGRDILAEVARESGRSRTQLLSQLGGGGREIVFNNGRYGAIRIRTGMFG
jgi:hypothetical protein